MPFSRLTALSATTLSTLSMLAACAHAAPPAGSTLSLTERQSVTVAPGAILTYDSVADSRCPPDVQCVVAGKIAYTFTLKQGDTLEHFTLSPLEPVYTSPVLNGKRITLADTAPAPRAKLAATAHPVSIKVVAP